MREVAMALPPALNHEEALYRLMRARREPIPRSAAREALGEQPSDDDIMHEMERRGFQARWSQIDFKNFKCLDLPTLVALGFGKFLLIHEFTGGHVLCEGMDETKGRVPMAVLSAHCSGSVLDISPALPSGSLWERIFKLIITQRQALYPILGIALLTQGLGLLTPQFTRLLVDQAFPQGARSLFTILILGTVIQGVFQSWMGWTQSRFVIYLETRLSFFIEQGLMSHLLRLPLPFLSTKTMGDLMQGFYGISTAKDFLTGSVLSTFINNITTIGYLVMMARLMPAATAVVTLFTLVYVGVTILVSRHLAKIQGLAVEAQSKERSFLAEMLNGLPVIKASGAEQRAEARWNDLYRRKRGISLYSQRFNLTSMGILGLFQGLFTQVLTIWGGLRVLRGELQLGEMLAFIMMAGTFQGAIAGAGNLYVQLMMMKPQLDKVREILDVPAMPPQPHQEPRPMLEPVVIQDLWFRYSPETTWVLKGLNLTIQPGEKFLVRGPSGCGKSTLLKLIAGLYPTERGSITLAGTPPEQARHYIAYLPQFVQLFDGSVLDNLRLLSGVTNRIALLEAAEHTGLHELVLSLPMGYETLVSSGGINFSGGQRQLIALTAVLASSKSVLLLDEAMANIDSIWKARLFKSPLFLGKTIIFASHEEGQGRPELIPADVRQIIVGGELAIEI